MSIVPAGCANASEMENVERFKCSTSFMTVTSCLVCDVKDGQVESLSYTTAWHLHPVAFG